MSTPAKTPWRIAGEAIGGCNCAWGCPCQFNALPTHGRCEGLGGWQIREGYFGTTRLDGVRFARIFWWPGPIHEGNGTRHLIIDEHATPDQRAALMALESGTQGGAFFEIFAAVCPNVVDPVFVPIIFQSDRERRQALLRIPGIVELRTEPIKNPVTGEEHRARIVLPDGFEYKEAEVGNTVLLRVQSGAPLVFEHADTYAQLNAFDWSNT
ncbi:MAG TPA: DUF1326 domain-containing protein [Candidatus Tectomicrobia bacterium]|nr:DUF1326 domain-containing protein [Candidatus Tectomicrobia bacterium]